MWSRLVHRTLSTHPSRPWLPPKPFPMYPHPSAFLDVLMGTPPFRWPATIATQSHTSAFAFYASWKIFPSTRTLETSPQCCFTSCPIPRQRPTKNHQCWRIPPRLPISQHDIAIPSWSLNDTGPHAGSSPCASSQEAINSSLVIFGRRHPSSACLSDIQDRSSSHMTCFGSKRMGFNTGEN